MLTPASLALTAPLPAESLPATTQPTTPLLTINLDAIAANTRFFAAHTTGDLIAVVKADGYGHGAADVARTALAHGASILGVTSIDEALALREAGFTAPIISWLNHPEANFRQAAAQRIDVAVPSIQHLEAVANAGTTAGDRTRVHLHLDTGMARDGAEPMAWIELCLRAREAERAGRIKVVGLMGHLGDADNPNAASNDLGLALFEWGLDVARRAELRPSILHLAATSASLTLPKSRFTASRVGAGLVGIDLSRTATLETPMTLTAPIISVRSVTAGTAVGYGQDWIATHSTRLALVGLGYADGLPRSSSGKSEVLLGGQRRRIVGRMSMDQLVVDLADSGARVGDAVTVFGPGAAGEPTIREWAQWSGTIEHEIVTRVGARVRRTLSTETKRAA